MGPQALRVLALLAEGFNAREIADQLELSFFSVRSHIRTIRAELGARNTAHAVHLAHQRKLLA